MNVIKGITYHLVLAVEGRRKTIILSIGSSGGMRHQRALVRLGGRLGDQLVTEQIQLMKIQRIQ